jgi:hypothetical protein
MKNLMQKELTFLDLVVTQDIEFITPKLFYEIVKSKPATLAEKHFQYAASDEKHSLGEYSDKQREYWKTSKNIVVYESEDKLRNFIKLAKNNKIINSKMYFGKVNKELAERIKNETGLDIEGYNLSISANEIRKIFKDHGKESTETPRGQRIITEDDIVNIPLIVSNPDIIKLSDEMYRKKQVIMFIKTLNGKTAIVSYVSHTPHDLTVQTMYSGRKKS